MPMQREIRSDGGIGDYYYHADRSLLMEPSSKPFPFSSSPPPLPPSSSPPLPPSFSPTAAGYIEHTVSKFDTLAGVAIKYGVEVADIKKMNGLVTDLQMFGLKTLQIPLPGRHPPSPVLLNGSESQWPSNHEQTPVKPFDLFDSFQSLKIKSTPHRSASSGMCSLQDNYDLQSTNQKVYVNGKEEYHSNPPLSHHRKCRSLAYDLSLANSDLSNDLLLEEETLEPDKWIEKLVRRRQKSEADINSTTPEKVLKDDGNSSASFSATAGKGVALRAKAASRAAEAAEGGWPSNIGLGLWDSFVAASTNGVRKSLSTPSFQDQEISTSTSTSTSSSSSSNYSTYSSLWPVASKWSSLKPDLQALSNAALARPIFDGLANNPITGRRNKTAVD